MSERWLPIPGYEEYAISDHGRLKRIATNKIRKFGIDRYGYYRIQFHKRVGLKTITIHRLVMLAFVGPCPAGLEIAHLDGNRKNNTLSNLIYCTRKENAHHQFAHGTAAQGEKHPQAKLTAKQVRYIRRSKERVMDMAERYGVKRNTISQIKHRRSWRSLND